MASRGARRSTCALALACLALAGCGSSPRSASSTHAQTASATPANTANTSEHAFSTHAGLAFGAFYHFIYAPYAAGEFRDAASNHALLARATAVASYIDTQVEQATAAARGSARLAKLVPPLTLLDRGLRAALVRLRMGHLKLSQIQVANLAISSIKGAALSAGVPITEMTPSSV